MSLKESYHLFTQENETVKVGLSKFCDLRPQNIKLFDQIPPNVCVCIYHENVCLLLGELQRHTDLSSGFAEFVKQITCDESSVECIYRNCEICKNQLDNFAPFESNELLIKYHQWQTVDKKLKKFVSLQL